METDTWEKRLLDERKELSEKLYKLSDFLFTDKPDYISNLDWSLLIIQESSMRTYLGVLDTRINILSIKDKNNGN